MTVLSRVLAIAALAIATTFAAPAQQFRVGDIIVTQPWARATSARMPNGAAFMTLTTQGSRTDRLVAISTSAAVQAQVHITSMDGGVMKMQPVEIIEVAPDAPTTLEPGGLHVMLMGLNGALVQGTAFPMTLTFERAGDLEVQVKVQGPGAMRPARAGDR